MCNFFMIKILRLVTTFSTVTEKVMAKCRILMIRLDKFVTEVLLFRGNLSQMFFKLSVLKNLAILEPFLIFL